MVLLNECKNKRSLAELHTLQRHNELLEARLEALQQEIRGLRDELRRVVEQCDLDPITGLRTRGAFERHLREILPIPSETAPRPCLLMVSIDHFFELQQDFGQLAANAVLRRLAGLFQEQLPRSALLARYEEDQAVALLTTTASTDVNCLAEAIRSRMEQRPLTSRTHSQPVAQLTISAAIVSIVPQETANLCLQTAELVLAAAQNQGGNRILTREKLREDLT